MHDSSDSFGYLTYCRILPPTFRAPGSCCHRRKQIWSDLASASQVRPLIAIILVCQLGVDWGGILQPCAGSGGFCTLIARDVPKMSRNDYLLAPLVSPGFSEPINTKDQAHPQLLHSSDLINLTQIKHSKPTTRIFRLLLHAPASTKALLICIFLSQVQSPICCTCKHAGIVHRKQCREPQKSFSGMPCTQPDQSERTRMAASKTPNQCHLHILVLPLQRTSLYAWTVRKPLGLTSEERHTGTNGCCNFVWNVGLVLHCIWRGLWQLEACRIQEQGHSFVIQQR